MRREGLILVFVAISACESNGSHVQSALTAVCGNGIVEDNEECDDGNLINTDDCLATCVIATCGDGVRNITGANPEACDDGNHVTGDGCSRDCSSDERCGNGIVDIGEACDDGNTTDGTCANGDPCEHPFDCASGICMPDGCSADCKSTQVCGNGIKDIGEVCDDGGAPGGCEDDCQHGVGCGNGVLDGNEECDDGNLTDTDDCTSGCKINVCGDGILDTTGITHHETCDAGVNGVAIETANCNLDCTIASCGDGKVNQHRGEQCDAGAGGNADNRDCTAACQLNVCGDGHRDTLGSHVEQCDDGNTINNDGCNVTCHTPVCGNGIVDQGEACDDGNAVNTDGCSNLCTYN
jgi:cysteine-rich repeat protein